MKKNPQLSCKIFPKKRNPKKGRPKQEYNYWNIPKKQTTKKHSLNRVLINYLRLYKILFLNVTVPIFVYCFYIFSERKERKERRKKKTLKKKKEKRKKEKKHFFYNRNWCPCQAWYLYNDLFNFYIDRIDTLSI